MAEKDATSCCDLLIGDQGSPYAPDFSADLLTSPRSPGDLVLEAMLMHTVANQVFLVPQRRQLLTCFDDRRRGSLQAWAMTVATGQSSDAFQRLRHSDPSSARAPRVGVDGSMKGLNNASKRAIQAASLFGYPSNCGAPPPRERRQLVTFEGLNVGTRGGATGTWAVADPEDNIVRMFAVCCRWALFFSPHSCCVCSRLKNPRMKLVVHS